MATAGVFSLFDPLADTRPCPWRRALSVLAQLLEMVAIARNRLKRANLWQWHNEPEA